MSSLFVIVPGFGGPHVRHKVEILRSNLAVIEKYPWKTLQVRVCVYDNNAAFDIPSDLRDHPRIHWIFETGIVGQFIHKWASPNEIATHFDYVMILLDDIELSVDNFDFSTIIRWDNMFHLDIYSPSMTPTSKYQFQYMLQKPNQPYHISVTSACEAFCYFMPSASYSKYYQHIDPIRNPWLWGIDMCIHKYLGMRVGLINCMTMHHYYKNECYAQRPDADPTKGYNSVLARFGVTSEELADQKAVMYYIVDAENLPQT